MKDVVSRWLPPGSENPSELASLLKRAVGLKFVPEKRTITEFLGLGSQSAVFKVGDIGVKIPRCELRLAAQLAELPYAFVTQDDRPTYDLDVLNAKLQRLVGSRYLCDMIYHYEGLCHLLLNLLVSHEETDELEEGVHAMRVVAESATVERGLKALSYTDDTPVAAAAARALQLLERVRLANDDTPEGGAMESNPLLVWAGARLNCFITVEETGRVVDFVRRKYAVSPWMFGQCGGMAACFDMLDHDEYVKKFLGFVFAFLSDRGEVWRQEAAALERGFAKCGGTLRLARPDGGESLL